MSFLFLTSTHFYKLFALRTKKGRTSIVTNWQENIIIVTITIEFFCTVTNRHGHRNAHCPLRMFGTSSYTINLFSLRWAWLFMTLNNFFRLYWSFKWKSSWGLWRIHSTRSQVKSMYNASGGLSVEMNGFPSRDSFLLSPL